MLAKCLALLREISGSSLTLQVQLQGQTKLEGGQDKGQRHQILQLWNQFSASFALVYPLSPGLVLYPEYQASSCLLPIDFVLLETVR